MTKKQTNKISYKDAATILKESQPSFIQQATASVLVILLAAAIFLGLIAASMFFVRFIVG